MAERAWAPQRKNFGGDASVPMVLGFASCSGGSECMCMCMCMCMGVVWMMDGDVISVTACQAIANIVKTSLGPVGLDKVRFLAISLFSCILDSFLMLFSHGDTSLVPSAIVGLF